MVGSSLTDDNQDGEEDEDEVDERLFLDETLAIEDRQGRRYPYLYPRPSSTSPASRTGLSSSPIESSQSSQSPSTSRTPGIFRLGRDSDSSPEFLDETFAPSPPSRKRHTAFGKGNLIPLLKGTRGLRTCTTKWSSSVQDTRLMIQSLKSPNSQKQVSASARLNDIIMRDCSRKTPVKLLSQKSSTPSSSKDITLSAQKRRAKVKAKAGTKAKAKPRRGAGTIEGWIRRNRKNRLLAARHQDQHQDHYPGSDPGPVPKSTLMSAEEASEIGVAVPTSSATQSPVDERKCRSTSNSNTFESIVTLSPSPIRLERFAQRTPNMLSTRTPPADLLSPQSDVRSPSPSPSPSSLSPVSPPDTENTPGSGKGSRTKATSSGSLSRNSPRNQSQRHHQDQDRDKSPHPGTGPQNPQDTTTDTSHSRQIIRMFSSPSFVRHYEEVKLNEKPSHLHIGDVVRKKEDRHLLHGFDCKCCAGYYNALGLNTPEKANRIDQVSRHRGLVPQPPTPEHYWEVHMADREEQKRRGQIVESDSPFVLKTRHPHYRVVVNTSRKLFK